MKPAPGEDERQTVFADLVRAETRLYNAVDDRLRKTLDTSVGRYEVLEHLLTQPHCRVHDVANEFAITIGAASKAIDRIEAAGLCTRTVDPTDRRSSQLELTHEGEALALRARQVFDAEVRRRLDAALTPAQQRCLGIAVRVLRRELEEDGTTGGTGRRTR